MSTSSSSDLIQLRLKLVDGKYFVDGVDAGSKSIKGLGKATTETATKQKYAEKTTSRLTGSYRKMGEAAKWGLGFLGVGGVLAIESSIHATENLAMSTSGLSRSFGLSTHAASSWAAVMSSRGVDPKALTMTFGSLSTKMTEAARKGGSLLTPFHQLGISQEEVAKGADNFQWGIMRVAKALGEEEGGARRSTAAKALLGRGFSTLLPLMSEGSKGLHENLKAAEEYGATLTNVSEDEVMGMVKSQRLLQLGMLGVQIQMTKALMPAVEAGEGQLEEFFKTLNSPTLTGEQKLQRITHQFDGLENEVIHVIEQALPTIAEHAGHLGVVMAGALLQGFQHSNAIGKIAIGAWVFSMLGGEDLAKAGAKKVGGMIGTEMGIGLATGAIGAYVAYELVNHMSARSKEEIKHWAEQAGADFVNYFAREISNGLDEINPLGNLPFGLSVAAPNIPEVSGPGPLGAEEILGGSPEIVHGHPHGHPRGNRRGTPKQVREAERALEAIEGERRRKRGHTAQAGRARPRTELLQDGSRASSGHRGGDIVINLRSEIDGKVVAESTTRHALDAAALA